MTAASAPLSELRYSVDNWDLLVRESERLHAELKHKTLLVDRAEQSLDLLTQRLDESLTESARLEREVQAARATVDTQNRTITGLTVRLTEERLNTSVLREHVAACTDWMRKRPRAGDSD